jgi:hypothetical protein
MAFDYDPSIPHGRHNLETGIDYDYEYDIRHNRRASMPDRPQMHNEPSIPRRASIHDRGAMQGQATIQDQGRGPMLAMRAAQNDGPVPVIMSVYIVRRWYTQQEVLKVKNHNTDITFRFMCAKGTVTLGPGENWEHTFIRGAVAQRTMDGLAIMDVWQGERQLFGNEIKIIMQRHDSSCGQVRQPQQNNGPIAEQRDSSGGSMGGNIGKLFLGALASAN